MRWWPEEGAPILVQGGAADTGRARRGRRCRRGQAGRRRRLRPGRLRLRGRALRAPAGLTSVAVDRRCRGQGRRRGRSRRGGCGLPDSAGSRRLLRQARCRPRQRRITLGVGTGRASGRDPRRRVRRSRCPRRRRGRGATRLGRSDRPASRTRCSRSPTRHRAVGHGRPRLGTHVRLRGAPGAVRRRGRRRCTRERPAAQPVVDTTARGGRTRRTPDRAPNVTDGGRTDAFVVPACTTPLVSVCMVTFGAREWVERSLRALVDNTSVDYELIVVDNGSTDGTVEMMQARLRGARIVVPERNLGFAAGNDLAVAHRARPVPLPPQPRRRSATRLAAEPPSSLRGRPVDRSDRSGIRLARRSPPGGGFDRGGRRPRGRVRRTRGRRRPRAPLPPRGPLRVCRLHGDTEIYLPPARRARPGVRGRLLRRRRPGIRDGGCRAARVARALGAGRPRARRDRSRPRRRRRAARLQSGALRGAVAPPPHRATHLLRRTPTSPALRRARFRARRTDYW